MEQMIMALTEHTYIVWWTAVGAGIFGAGAFLYATFKLASDADDAIERMPEMAIDHLDTLAEFPEIASGHHDPHTPRDIGGRRYDDIEGPHIDGWRAR